MIDRHSLMSWGFQASNEPSQHEVLVLNTIDDSDAKEWNSIVDQRPGGTIFHRSEWLEAIETAFPYEPCHIEVRKDGNLIGILPQFRMPLPKVPFYQVRSTHPGYGGPLITTDQEEAFWAILNETARICRRRTVLHEIRVCEPAFLRYSDHFRRAGYEPARYKARFVLDLDQPYEDIRAGMYRSRQRGIEQGRTTDHEVIEEPLASDVIDRFHQVHSSHMKEVGGDPFPRPFFAALSEMEDRVLLLSLFLDGEYVGGFLELLDEYRDTVHGIVAALPPEFYEYHISELMYDEVIRWAQAQGYARYDFGGSGGDFSSGVYRFKQGFGGHLEPNFYWERGFGPFWPLIKRGRTAYLQSDI